MDHSAQLAHREASEASRFVASLWRGFAGAAAWDDLARRAAQPNPFFERWFLCPGLAAFDTGHRVVLATLNVGDTLAGAIPLVRASRYEGHALPHIASWLHSNAFLGLPLVAAGHEREFWTGLLDWCDRNAGTALFLHLHAIPTDGPVYEALRDICRREGRTARVVHRYERALLSSDLGAEAYFEGSVSGKKRKELRRQAARLADLGPVQFERTTAADGVNSWVDAFLELESSGWKGSEGSALACDPAKAEFFRKALAGAAQAGRLERLAMTVDGRPVAMLATFIAPPGAFSFKTAYDETLAKYSPGVLMQRENLAVLDRDDVAWSDSCAAPDHPMIERIWREKREIVRVSIAIGGRVRRAAGHAIIRAEAGGQARGL